jgi:hypothetical protein
MAIKDEKQKQKQPDGKRGKYGPSDDGGGGGGGKGQDSGRRPEPAEAQFLKARFKNMKTNSVLITGAQSDGYNCMALTLNKSEPIWPEEPFSGATTKARLDALYRRVSDYRPAPTGHEGRTGDIAVWGDSNGVVRHVSIVLDGGKMESKLGRDYRIIHSANDLQGGKYGNFLYYLTRPSHSGPDPSDKKRKEVSARSLGATSKGAGELERLLVQVAAKKHSLLINGKALPLQEMEREITALSKALVKQFRGVVEEAQREATLRRELWANPLTSPAKVGFPSDYWVHFVVNLDTVRSDVDYPEWVRCKDRNCPENVGCAS